MAHYKGAASEGGRALQLQKQREKEREDLELRKKKLEDDLKLSAIGNKFATHYDAIEQQIKSSTVGLVTLDQMKARQEDLVKERERQLALKKESIRKKEIETRNEQKEKQKRQIKALSFKFDDDEDEENEEHDEDDANDAITSVKEDQEDDTKKSASDNDNDSQLTDNSNDALQMNEPQKKKLRMVKNPDVDTSFLPDRQREEEENKLRDQLRQEWTEKQTKLKNEDIEVTFSYWDGSGHRRAVQMKKGNSVYQFLQKALELLRKEFHELRTVTTDQLMYIKEDLIIPHHYSFYDFIVTKARGKSGPLFSFDVHEDVRLVSDATVERDESHAGKVLLRSWYERNKHIFPASRWEPYDPNKNYDKYTIGDRTKK